MAQQNKRFHLAYIPAITNSQLDHRYNSLEVRRILTIVAAVSAANPVT
jgi:hypothetical protein